MSVHDNRDILTANGYRFPPPIPQNREDGTPGFACPVEGCNLWSVYRQRLVDHLNDHAGCKPYGCTHPGKGHLLLSAIWSIWTLLLKSVHCLLIHNTYVNPYKYWMFPTPSFRDHVFYRVSPPTFFLIQVIIWRGLVWARRQILQRRSRLGLWVCKFVSLSGHVQRI